MLWWARWGRSCRFRPNNNNVLVHYGNFTIIIVSQWKKHFVGIGPKSAISVQLCLLRHGGSSERLLKWAIRAESETTNLKGCPMFMITVPWPLCEGVWHFICPQTNILALILIKKIVEIVHFHILPTLGIVRHRKCERLFIFGGHWTVPAGPKYVIFHIFKEK